MHLQMNSLEALPGRFELHTPFDAVKRSVATRNRCHGRTREEIANSGMPSLHAVSSLSLGAACQPG